MYRLILTTDQAFSPVLAANHASLNTAPQVGAHGDKIFAPSGDLDDTISRRLVDSPSRPPSFNPTSGSANKYARPCRLYPEQREIRTGPDSGYPVPQNSFMSGPRGSFTSRVQSLGDSCTRTPSIPLRVLTYWASGLIPLGRLYLRPLQYYFHSLGLTGWFALRRSDPQVLANLLRQWQDPCFYYLRNPDPPISCGSHNFYGRLYPGVGRLHGGFPDIGCLDPYRTQAPHQLFGAQGGYVCPTTLGPSAPGPPGYDRYGQFDSSFLYQKTRRDTFPHLVTSNSRTSPLVRGSEHNSPSWTYSRLSERDSRPPISSESANFDRVVPSPRDSATYLQGLGDTRD